VTGERIPAHSRAGSGVSHREAPSNAFFPDRRSRSDPLAGSAPGIWVCRRTAASIDTALARPTTGPIPGSAIRAKVNRFCPI